MNELDVEPTTQREILNYSYQYQKEWRFEREKRLMNHALTLFPGWEYAHKRLEWHSRSIFHKDPSKSKTQPRQPLNLARDANYIPSTETIDSLCFVTGTDSNPLYFNLCVQLIESIKATRWYNHVPIKVLDCGLTQEDANYLRQRFGCEVKDPGWDVDPQKINRRVMSHWSYNGWKGIVARPYMKKHFPGYQYYFWVDADTWIQTENALDVYLKIAEEQGLSVSVDYNGPWNTRLFFARSLPVHCLSMLKDKMLIQGGIYCISASHLEKYQYYCDELIKERKEYLWGFDMSSLNAFFYKEINGVIFHSEFLPVAMACIEGGYVDSQFNIFLDSKLSVVSGIISLAGGVKIQPYSILFPRTNQAKHMVDQALKYSIQDFEEYLYQCVLQKEVKLGNYFYRIYPEPEIEL